MGYVLYSAKTKVMAVMLLLNGKTDIEPTWLFQAGSEAGLGFRLKVNNRQGCTGTTKCGLQLVDLLKEGLLDF
ncbi:hypothetical protein CROQUDRAFT_88318 [Cronartium quercuum f. sp. fusiforme G11]|uniref:Uncharacterized protein n=1 Tax=Cronartium quercuum f. sp. fusiforme G11 TaxID=708437 RepID=A0A9P6TFK9_9BASI|nr:hypothetical protein CROQUDRAFT_88318 [Cronartium quercuum f. sp. fusiforme G11]